MSISGCFMPAVQRLPVGLRDREPPRRPRRPARRTDAGAPSGSERPAMAAPAELMTLPQLGSPPCMQVFTSGESAMARATFCAWASSSAPATASRMILVAPSPSATIIRAMRSSMASRAAPRRRQPLGARASRRRPRCQEQDRVVGAHLPVDRHPVERAVDGLARASACISAGATTASVVTTHSMVAMAGEIMPAPLAHTPSRTVPSGRVDLQRAHLGEAVGGHDGPVELGAAAGLDRAPAALRGAGRHEARGRAARR